MITIPIEPVVAFLFVLLRVFFFFSFLPIVGDPFTPVRVRALLSVAVAFLCAPLTHVDPAALPQSLPEFLLLALPEAFLGMVLGFVGRLMFGAVQFAGTLIGEQIGFGMASIIDPSQTGQMPVVGQVLYVASLLVFLGINGDHHFLTALVQTFHTAPPGVLFVTEDLNAFFTRQASAMFILAVRLSLPIIAAIFIANVGIAMLTKGVPTINVLMESFPIRIMLGLFILALVSGFFVRLVAQEISRLPGLLDELLRLTQ